MLQEVKVPKVYLEIKDHKVLKEQQDPMVQMVHKVRKEHKDLKEQLEDKVLKELKVHRVLEDL